MQVKVIIFNFQLDLDLFRFCLMRLNPITVPIEIQKVFPAPRFIEKTKCLIQ